MLIIRMKGIASYNKELILINTVKDFFQIFILHFAIYNFH